MMYLKHWNPWHFFSNSHRFELNNLPHDLTCFRGIIGPSGPFTPRFGVFSWDYWTFGSVCRFLILVDSGL